MVSAEKTNKNVSVARQQQATGTTFFRKAGEETFFKGKENSSFFGTVQPKLTISKPDDPLEKEADAVAETVMRMPETTSAITEEKDEKLQRKEEEEDEEVQPKLEAHRITAIQRKEENIQPKISSSIQRSADESFDDANTVSSSADNNNSIHPKHISLQRSDVIQQSGRGPPQSFIPVEHTLQSSKGAGSPLPDATRLNMESRFNADFNGVRIHTGSTAQSLSSNIHAQAFTHGNDIYFNSGRYAPHTADGSLLLAHELTHTIQQGASAGNTSSINKAARKVIQRSIADNDVVAGIDISAKTGGSVLPGEAKDYLQNYYHTNLNDIRIHTDNEAADVCKTLGVSAYTKDKNILVKPSNYDPESEQGAILLSDQISISLRQRGIRTTGADGNAVSFAGLINQITEAVKEQAASVNKNANQNTNETTPEIPNNGSLKQPGKKEVKGSKKGKIDNKKNTKGVNDEAALTKQVKKNGKKSPSSPAEDPAFQKVVKRTKKTAKDQQQHEPATEKATDAQKAAEAVPNEAESKAQNRKTDGMGKATEEDKPFNAEAFKAELLKKIEDVTPKTLEDATEFKENNKIAEVKTAMGEKVAAEKENSTGPVNKATTEPLQVNEGDNKQPVTLPATDKGPKPAGVGAKDAAPKSKLESEISLEEQSQSLDEEMKSNNVTEDQLANSNEPSFTAALDEKRAAQKDAKEKPLEYRKDESLTLTEAKASAQQDAGQSLVGMHSSRGKNFETTVKTQQTAKQKDEERRAAVVKSIEDKYAAAELKVTTLLTDADTEANKIFDEGSEAARIEFENYVDARMSAYKADRYSGFWGGLRWAKDKLFGMPDEVNEFYTKGRQLYLNKMDSIITQVANIVTTKLNEAKQAIKDGKKEIDECVAELPKDLQDVGKEAQANIQDKFDVLEQNVNDKKEQLIDGLAKKYVDNLKKLDDRITELKEANQGLIDKAIGFLKKVWQVIKDLYNLFTTILARLASIIGVIMDNPSGFFDNLGKAFNQGFNNFKDKFTEYLETGLMEWLSTNLGIKGIEMPEKFNASAIFTLALQVMGITKDHIRERAVHLLGEEKVELLEGAGGILYRIGSEGVGAIWDMISEKLTDFKDMVWEAIKSFIQKSIIDAAIVFILSLLNPIGAFVKVCMAIYDFLMMLVRFKDRIIELLDTILSAVTDIASGAVDAAAKSIEKALAKSISVIIGFLAALLHLNNVALKVKEIIVRIQKRVEKAIDWVILKAYSIIGKGVEGALRIKNKGKELVEKGKQKVVSAGKKVVGALKNLLGLSKEFTASDGEIHKLYYAEERGGANMMVRSSPVPINVFLRNSLVVINGMTGNSKKRLLRIHTSAGNAHELIQYNESLLELEQDRGKQNAIQKTIQIQMNVLAGYMVDLLPASGQAYPPAVLPPMVNGVKARGFTAEYISIAVPDGTEASAYDGRSLQGWGLLVGAGLNINSAYVKMHLLPHRLGGDAVDSNLTPAPGQSVNLTFSRSLEVPAITAKNGGETIWYKVSINYHSGSLTNAFPSFIQSEWGPYRRNNGQLEKITSSANTFGLSVPLPPLTNSMIINAAQDRMIADFLKIDFLLAKLIVRIRGKLGNYTSLIDVITKLNTNATTADKNRVGNFDNAVEALMVRLENFNGRITF